MVGSCRNCDMCKAGLEQHCTDVVPATVLPIPKARVRTWRELKGNIPMVDTLLPLPSMSILFYHIPDGMDMKYTGVLLCAGITTFSPLYRHILQKEEAKRVAIVGFGGLGQMAIKISKAMGVENVTILSRDNQKCQPSRTAWLRLH
jgi:alcohol dehydrogenase (NADP+)